MSEVKALLKEAMETGQTKSLVEAVLKEYCGEMPQALATTYGPSEGGVHGHGLTALTEGRWLVTSDKSGHRHLIEIDGRVHITEADGFHTHEAGPADLRSAPEGKHTHQLVIEGQLYESSPGTAHDHELLSYDTVVDGTHTHTFTIDGKKVRTVTPLDRRRERAMKAKA